MGYKKRKIQHGRIDDRGSDWDCLFFTLAYIVYIENEKKYFKSIRNCLNFKRNNFYGKKMMN
jgi:hypothetical protein